MRASSFCIFTGNTFNYCLEIIFVVVKRGLFILSLSVVSHSRDNVQGLAYDSIAAASLRRSFRVPRNRLGVGCER